MSKSRNEQLLTPRPSAPGQLENEAHRGDAARRTRRSAESARIYKNRLKAMTAIGVLAIAGGAAGSGRLLAHDVEQGAQDAFNNRVEAVDKAFSDPHPEVVTGEPSNADAAHQVQLNEAHNAAVAAAEADQAEARSSK